MNKNSLFLAIIGFISQCTLHLARYNESNDLSTFLCLPNNTICQTLQNTFLFLIQLLHSTRNAYHTAIFLGLGTDNSRWGQVRRKRWMRKRFETQCIKKDFFLLQMWPFLLDFAKKSIQ